MRLMCLGDLYHDATISPKWRRVLLWSVDMYYADVRDEPCQCHPDGYCSKDALEGYEYCRRDRAEVAGCISGIDFNGPNHEDGFTVNRSVTK